MRMLMLQSYDIMHVCTQAHQRFAPWIPQTQQVVSHTHADTHPATQYYLDINFACSFYMNPIYISMGVHKILPSTGGHHMCVGEVVEHILLVLRNPRTVVWLCGDYSWILVHSLLQKPHYVLQISSNSWSGEPVSE